MSNNDIIRKLIGLQDANVKEVKETEKEIEIYVELDVKEHICPCCGERTTRIHDYRIQKITDIPYRGKVMTIVYRKRRYVCKHCDKRFYEKNSFVPRYYQMTNRLSAYIIEQLSGSNSFTEVAKEVGKSVSTVIRVFDMICFSRPKLPTTLSIDEFKGNAGSDKYQAILQIPKRTKFLIYCQIEENMT